MPESPLPLRRVTGAQVADGQRCAGRAGGNIIEAMAAHGGFTGRPRHRQELLLSERRLLEPVEREWRRLFVVRIQQRCADGQAAQEAATIGIGDGAAPECGPAPESRVAEECKGVMNGAEGRYHGAILGGQEERTSRAMCEIFRMAAQGVRSGRIGAYGSVGTSYPDGQGHRILDDYGRSGREMRIRRPGFARDLHRGGKTRKMELEGCGRRQKRCSLKTPR